MTQMPEPLDAPNDLPYDPAIKRVRRNMLNMPIEMPGTYCDDPSPDNPWAVTEYRFNAAGHLYDLLGCFPTEAAARKAASDFLCHADRFVEIYHGKFMGFDVINGLTYSCYAFDHPLDVMGFAVKVELLS